MGALLECQLQLLARRQRHLDPAWALHHGSTRAWPRHLALGGRALVSLRQALTAEVASLRAAEGRRHLVVCITLLLAQPLHQEVLVSPQVPMRHQYLGQA